VNESVNIEAEKPNNRAALDAGWSICLHIGHDWSGASEHARWANKS
jgi:hypothetical protein